MKHAQDSDTTTHKAKCEPGDPDYPERVARPIMNAIDIMPKLYRQCVHDFGYVDVYRAWRKGWTVERIREHARAAGGFFKLPE